MTPLYRHGEKTGNGSHVDQVVVYLVDFLTFTMDKH